MINRTETGLSEALHELEGLKTEATTLSTQKAQDSEIAALARLQSQIQLAQEMVKAMAQANRKPRIALSNGLNWTPI